MTEKAQPPEPQTRTRPLTPIPIDDRLLRAVYASDQAMYPVALSYGRLCAWVAACPDLSICFRDTITGTNTGTSTSTAAPSSVDAGVIIVLPLQKRYWEGVLSGEVKEADIEASMFAGCEEGREGEMEEVGLHVYHVEKFATGSGANRGRGFAEFALEEVMRRVEARRGWKVIGISALTATPAGKRTFERLGFTPTGYRELFIAKTVQGQQQIEITYVYPGGEPVQGAPGKAPEGDPDIVSVSEMSAKYIS